MNRTQVKEVIEQVSPAVEAIADTNVKSVFKVLLNVIEGLVSENDRLREDNQNLHDEVNRLKGEQGKPNIRKQTKENQDFSSENERKRKKKKKKKKGKKKNRIIINRVEFCQIDKTELPEDILFKGHHAVIVQDILITTNNIEFKKEIYYSPSLKKTFIAPLPDGYSGEFGPGIKTEVISLYHKSKMTESAIVEFLVDHNIFIGKATVSRILTDNHDEFHQEKKDIIQAGMKSTVHQQMDDTGARVNGKNYYAHILCNQFYTAYFTRPQKDRLTIIDILTQGHMKFTFNDTAFSMMEEMKLPEKWIKFMRESHIPENMGREEMDILLRTCFPDKKSHQTNRQIILDSTAIAAYRELPTAVKLLLTDDAPQYNQITLHHPLCWVHDGRHYKKLNPVAMQHRTILNGFIEQYWDYYDQLLAYKSAPTVKKAKSLLKQFDNLFSTKTDYEKLNERIEKTKEKKDQLLLVLKYPALPLHNNESELGARDQGRRRDISFHTMNAKGTESKDTFMTIAQTAKKLMVNFMEYVRDRVEKKYKMPTLASLIINQQKNLTFNSS